MIYNMTDLDEKDVCVVLTGSVDSGKCFGQGTMILKYDKSVTEVENINIGDEVIGDDYNKSMVTEVHNGMGPLYKILLKDNTSFVVNKNHILSLLNEKLELTELSVYNFINLNKKNKNSLFWFRKTPDFRITLIKFNIEHLPIGKYYGFSIDNKSKRFIMPDYSVVHNSSFMGVLTHGELDDGNGYARGKIAKHPHEKSTGKTSDIAVRTLENNNNGNTILVDLCGHEKYLKTTLFGITGYFPDYAVLVVSANRGMLPMTKEHMGILLFLNIPFVIVVTRVDLVENNPKIYNNSIISIKKILKIYNRKGIIINGLKDIKLSQEMLKKQELIATKKICKLVVSMKDSYNIVPIITISNKTGYYFNVIKKALLSLKPRKIWKSGINDKIFYIEDKFNPKGIGTVVSGLNRNKEVKIGDEMLLGPYGKEFIPVRVWSMHNNTKNSVKILGEKRYGCLAIRSIDKKFNINNNKIRKGMVVIDRDAGIKNICYQFTASVKVLNHSTTIMNNYIPVIHCGVIRQSARIIMEKDEHLKIGDEAEVKFRFVGHPEFMEIGSVLFFREGTTRGVGTVTSILPLSNDPNKEPGSPSRKSKRIKKSIRNL